MLCLLGRCYTRLVMRKREHVRARNLAQRFFLNPAYRWQPTANDGA